MKAVARRYRFEATHHLAGASEPWCYPHGHLYTVEVVAEATRLDDDEMVVDTDALDGAWDRIRGQYEGRDLNETHSHPTTVEAIADGLLFFFRNQVGDEVSAVTVWEDESRWGRASI